MEIKTNKELSKAVNEAIDASGYKKIWIAEQLGIRREVFARTLKKKNFSIDDANEILSLLGLEVHVEIVKKNKTEEY